MDVVNRERTLTVLHICVAMITTRTKANGTYLISIIKTGGGL